jgi:hypothetical protein
MIRTLTLATALGMAVLFVGCSSTQGSAPSGSNDAAEHAAQQQAASASGVRDFNLQVKCPGIHLEKTKLKWSDDKIEDHENVTPDDIAACESWEASQPKGYVPPPPAGVASAPPAGATKAQ